MGTRSFQNLDDAERFMDTGFVGPEQMKRQNLKVIEHERQRIAQIMADHHAQTAQRVDGVTGFALRMAEEGAGRVDEIVEDLHDGRISAREAAAQLASAKRDLNRIAKEVRGLPAVEERAWSEVNKDPAEYRRDVARRFPALFKDGRNQIVLATNDND